MTYEYIRESFHDEQVCTVTIHPASDPPHPSTPPIHPTHPPIHPTPLIHPSTPPHSSTHPPHPSTPPHSSTPSHPPSCLPTGSCVLLQVLYYREDPRIREQEWGNFQDPEEVAESMAKRREIGAFYFRFPTGERYAFLIW